MSEIIVFCRKSKIKFCLDNRIGLIYIDMTNIPWWKRLFKVKEFVLWQEDIENLKLLLELNQIGFNGKILLV
jgi:hypothetical protein